MPEVSYNGKDLELEAQTLSSTNTFSFTSLTEGPG